MTTLCWLLTFIPVKVSQLIWQKIESTAVTSVINLQDLGTIEWVQDRARTPCSVWPSSFSPFSVLRWKNIIWKAMNSTSVTFSRKLKKKKTHQKPRRLLLIYGLKLDLLKRLIFFSRFSNPTYSIAVLFKSVVSCKRSQIVSVFERYRQECQKDWFHSGLTSIL